MIFYRNDLAVLKKNDNNWTKSDKNWKIYLYNIFLIYIRGASLGIYSEHRVRSRRDGLDPERLFNS